MAINFKPASADLLVEASKALFLPDNPEERSKFWYMFSIRSLKIFGVAITDELSLIEHWDKDKAFACFKSICAIKKIRIGKISPKKWRKALELSLEATKADRSKGIRKWFYASECIDEESAKRRCFEYELRTGVPGSSTNPVWHHFSSQDLTTYRSILIPDGRHQTSGDLPIVTKTELNRTKYSLAGFQVPMESVKKVEIHMYAPEVWAALKFGYYGLCFAEYMASNV
jgi:hypothetical protein